MRFRRDPSSLRGSIAPVVTPFTEDGELDTEGLRRLIGWQLDSGSHGISLGGSTGAVGFLQKPFLPEDLTTALRAVSLSAQG